MNASHFSKDCLEFIDVLNKHDVRWVIVGGEAVIYHGHVRLTGDVDFYFERTSENCRNLYQALEEFWNDDIPGGLSKRDLEAKGYFIQFGVPPNRLDLMNQIEAFYFERCGMTRLLKRSNTGE
ncbi:MAG: hypothetical protein R6V27_14850 [Balneolaceae bacterium]